MLEDLIKEYASGKIGFHKFLEKVEARIDQEHYEAYDIGYNDGYSDGYSHGLDECWDQYND